MRALVIGDSDSYVKWGAAVLDRMPADWQRSMVVIGTRAVPSAEQLATALAGSPLRPEVVPIVDLGDVTEHVRRHRPDVVLMSVRGQVVRVLVRAIVAAAAEAGMDRPVFVSGLPGISIPATSKALYFRSQADYFLLHSKREIRDFTALADKMGVTQSFGLATLPFLLEEVANSAATSTSTSATSAAASASASAPGGAGVGTSPHPNGSIVFAAQAKVPRERDDRLSILRALIDTARAFPERRVVIKVRARRGETQTHAEQFPYDELLEDAALLAAGETLPTNLVVEGGSMADHLAVASGLVTVSSTAAIEAIAVGVPVITLDDFGESADMINLVFAGSGLSASSTELRAGRFRTPAAGWLDDNYFHPAADSDWVAGIEELVRRRELGQLPLREQFRGRLGGAVRKAWDRKLALGDYDNTASGTAAYAVGVPLRAFVIFARTPIRAVRRRRNRLAREAVLAAAESGTPISVTSEPGAPTSGALTSTSRQPEDDSVHSR